MVRVIGPETLIEPLSEPVETPGTTYSAEAWAGKLVL